MGQPLLREWETETMTMRRSTQRGHRWLRLTVLILLVLLAVAGIGVAIAVHHAEPFLRALIVDRLEDRFHARVELDSFHVSLAHGLRAEGKGLRIWPPAEIGGVQMDFSGRSAPPLIALREFYFRAPLRLAPGKPIHIWTVTLVGLNVTIPPQPHRAPPNANPAPPPAVPLPRGAESVRFQIDSVVCRDGHVTLENANPAKLPLEFAIQTIRVAHVDAAGKMSFQAVLTNPRPRGQIAAQGNLGPWDVDDPGRTPLQGDYVFNHADLASFKGIAGTLSSTGRYRGTLNDLTVDGRTHTPAFSLTHFGTPVPLDTVFHARVDATNGDTWLEPVRATLGRTRFTASGKIVQVLAPVNGKGGPMHSIGHGIVLDVDVPQGQIADFLRLASRSGKPIVTGTLHMKTHFELPPGTESIHDRMRLKGTFALEDALFTNPRLQDRIGSLSLRGQGRTGAAPSAAASDVRSAMEGDFTIAGGAVDLPDLHYAVPGAEIRLNGVYGLDGSTLAFRGTARFQAPVSKLVGGWKGLLLKPVDPFFRKKGAGTVVHIHVEGTRADPHFGVNF